MTEDVGPWLYDPEDGLYHFEGHGPGLTRAEVEDFEDRVETHHIMKSQREV